MKERPTSVTVFAVINLIFCGLGVIGTIFWIISKLGLIPQGSQENPVTEIMENNTAYVMFTDVMSVVGIFITILLIAASIAMFSLKPWGRKVTIGWGLYSIVMTIVSLAVNYFVIFGPILADLTGPERIGIIIAVAFSAVITLFFVGYFLLMIFMLTRPHVVDAFTPEPDDPELDGWGDDPEPGGAEL